MQRDDFIDFIRGAGIFIVVLGHQYSFLTTYIYSFHMPLFFLISGVLWRSNLDNFSFFKRKIKSLVIPYFLFSLILFLNWSILGKKFQIKSSTISSLIGLRGVFIGTNIEDFSSILWGTPMWFLLCLFLVQVFYKNIERLTNKWC